MTPISSAFDDIRPYADHEVQGVIHRIITKPSFKKLVLALFPERSFESIVAELQPITTVHQLQKHLIHHVVRAIIRKTITELTCRGMKNVDHRKAHLFISNHRDIILDPAILNTLLFENSHETAQIAIGNNLLYSNLVADLMKLNKSFIVQRELGGQQMYEHTRHLSSYIRHVITELKQHVWIAQGNGRTKDGNDHTQTGLLKMLNISGGTDFVQSFEDLNIIPVSISYEYDPCDILKAVELYIRAQTDSYIKQPGEDKESMIKGLTENKGRVEIAIGKSIKKQELQTIASLNNKNERIRRLATTIDNQVYRSYRLWPTNYIAVDLLHKSKEYIEHYSSLERTSFLKYIEKRLNQAEITDELLEHFLLQIYANPVINKYKV